MITTFLIPSKMNPDDIINVMKKCDGHLNNFDRSFGKALIIALHATNITAEEIKPHLPNRVNSYANQTDEIFFHELMELFDRFNEKDEINYTKTTLWNKKQKSEDPIEFDKVNSALLELARRQAKNPENLNKMTDALMARMPSLWDDFDPFINALYFIKGI